MIRFYVVLLTCLLYHPSFVRLTCTSLQNKTIKSWAAQIGAETEPPMIGDLCPESVIDSTYFFVNSFGVL